MVKVKNKKYMKKLDWKRRTTLCVP